MGGKTWCWGANGNGELGTGTTSVSSTAPVAVATSAIFASLSLGWQQACGLDTAGHPWCWGVQGVAPTQLGTRGGFVSLAASGTGRACALDAAGAQTCWLTSQSDWGSVVDAPVAGTMRSVGLNLGGVCELRSDGQAYCALESAVLGSSLTRIPLGS